MAKSLGSNDVFRALEADSSRKAPWPAALILEALSTWTELPAFYDRYASFCRHPVPSDIKLLLNVEGEKKVVDLLYKGMAVEQTIRLPNEPDPVALCQFHAKVLAKDHVFTQTGTRELRWQSSKGLAHIVMAIRDFSPGYPKDENSFAQVAVRQSDLFYIEDQLKDRIALEMQLRSIESGNFLQSSDLCLSLYKKHPDLYSGDRPMSLWPGCLRWEKFRERLPREAELVYQAHIDCQRFKLKLEVELMQSKALHDNPVEVEPERPADGLSGDGLSLRWGGKLYPIKPRAAQVLRLLVDSFESGFPFLSEEYLKTEGESESDMRHLVRDGGLAGVVIREVGTNGKTIKGKWGLIDPRKLSTVQQIHT